ncbi:MAG: molybdopterin-dependent oxidoreductase [Vampirovibrio sp.]|nr:molybdopterin-dependent oxidoreductase [Vampirovibrio sp.]
MFQSLYKRHGQYSAKDHLADTGPNSKFLDWPASYEAGICTEGLGNWELEITGMVETPKTLDLAALQRLSKTTQNRRLVSIEGWSYRGEWSGILFPHLLQGLELKPGVKFVRQVNLAGQTETMPFSVLQENRAMLCYALKGQALPPLYGGPLRLLAFDRYSYKGLSQLSRLEFTDEDSPGLSKERGLPVDGQIRPGKYYAFDLRDERPIKTPGEVTGY